MLHYLSIGILLGMSAGLTPGPLLTLVISETLQHDIKSGIKVALAPVITDLPIILATVFILSELSGYHHILGVISLAGGVFILFMGYKGIRTTGIEINNKDVKPKSISKGILANVLNPHPYLFWFSVGAPTITIALNEGIEAMLAFIAGFYIFLVGSKIVLAVLVGKSKFLLSSKAYIYTIRFLGILLCILAVILFRDGLIMMKII